MRFLLSALVSLALVTTPVYAATPDVTVDGNSYLVSGGVIQSDIYSQDREEAAHCVDCHWTISVICQSWQDDAHGSCPYLRLRCPVDQRIAEVRRANAGSRPPTDSPLWKWVGYTCIRDIPASTHAVESTIHDLWRVHVRDLVVTTSPPLTTLVHLPTTFNFANGVSIPATSHLVAGTNVSVWAFTQRTINCHLACDTTTTNLTRFIESGHHTIDITLTWRGMYSADGLAASLIPGEPIVQNTQLHLTVAGIKRHLIPTHRR